MSILPNEGPLPEITVQSDRLLLRPFEPGDLTLIEEASSDDFIPTITTVPATFTSEAGLAFIERQADRLRTRTGWSLAIVDRGAQQPVGQIGLWLANVHHGRAEIGYWMAPSFRRQGHLRGALTLLTDWAFENLPVHRLTLYIEPWNVASIRTAEAGGYEREGLMRDWQVVDGEPKDMWSYVRLGAPVGVDLDHLSAELRELEEAMWRTSTRFSRDWMQEHLAHDFTEFGRSGRRYTRDDILALEDRDIDAELPLAEFTVRLLSHDCALVTYLGAVGGLYSNRSSVWRHTGERWLLTFHQGTPA